MEGPSNSNRRFNLNDLYKKRASIDESQANRRRKLLEHQKRNRRTAHDTSRPLLTQFEEEDKTESKPKNQNAFSKQLMLSEWMEEIPANFEDDWLMVPCPVGMRVLLVAGRGRTKAYTKHGRYIFEFQSALPGGRFKQFYKTAKNTILDCIYHKPTESFYILDLIAWGNQSLTNCDRGFRYFWLQGKLSEGAKFLEKNSHLNMYPILPLSHYECSVERISYVLNNWPLFGNNSPKVDGLLFYHKNALYTAGFTPTVLWLYPFMVPEIISRSVMVNDNYMREKPVDYKNQRLFIEKFNQERKSCLKSMVIRTEDTVDSSAISDLDQEMKLISI